MGTAIEKPTLTNLKEYPIEDAFELRKEEIAELSERYMLLGIEPDGTGRDEVHTALMDIVNRRTSITKTGKELRKEPTAFCKRVIACEKQLVELMTPIEDHLRKTRTKYDADVERRKREAEEARQEALKAKVHELAKYGHITTPYEVDAMTDVAYQATLEDAKQAHAEKLEREAAEKAERERLEAERKAREEAEREKQAAEQKRLREEQAAFERVRLRVSKLADFGVHVGTEAVADMDNETFDMYLAKSEKEFKAKKEAEAQAAARQEAEAKKLREEREALEAEKARILEEKAAAEAKAEQQRREKEAAERAAQAERERIEREQAEAKAKEEAEEAERKRQIKLRPDREKLESFAKLVESLEVPEFASGQIGDAVEAELVKCSKAIRAISKSL